LFNTSNLCFFRLIHFNRVLVVKNPETVETISKLFRTCLSYSAATGCGAFSDVTLWAAASNYRTPFIRRPSNIMPGWTFEITSVMYEFFPDDSIRVQRIRFEISRD